MKKKNVYQIYITWPNLEYYIGYKISSLGLVDITKLMKRKLKQRGAIEVEVKKIGHTID